MIVAALRSRRILLAAAILAADLVVAYFVADRIVRWELELIREAW